MAAGIVKFTSSTYIGATPYPGAALADAFDGNFATFYDAGLNDGSGNVGQDLGAGHATILTKCLISARRTAGTSVTDRVYKSLVQGSNDNSSWTTLATNPYLADTRTKIELPVSTSTAYRYFRLKHGADATPGDGYFSVAELEFFGQAVSGASMQACAPTCPLASGHFAYAVQCVLSSETTDATIYYTTDGTDPTTSSTAYTAPFTISATTTVKAIAVSVNASNSPISTFAIKIDQSFVDDQLPIGTDNLPIYGISPGFAYYNGTYYRVSPVPLGGNNTSDPTRFIKIYTSKDLLNWTPRGNVIDPRSPDVLASLATAGVTDAATIANINYNRPKIVRNPNNGNWLIIAQTFSAVNTSPNMHFIAESTTGPLGPYTAVKHFHAGGFDTFDHTIFVDNDGLLYLHFNPSGGGNRRTIRMLRDFKTVDAVVYSSDSDTGEGLILFRRGDTYFEINAHPSYYYASDEGTNKFGHVWRHASSLAGPWTTGTGDLLPSSVDSQSTWVIQVPDRTDGFIYTGDHWNATDLIDSTKVWYPLTFSDANTVAGSVVDDFTLTSAFGAGTAPLAPSQLILTKGTGSNTVSWVIQTPAQLYLQRSTKTDFSENLITYYVPEDSTSFVDSDVAANTTYFYRLAAVNTGGTTVGVSTSTGLGMSVPMMRVALGSSN